MKVDGNRVMGQFFGTRCRRVSWAAAWTAPFTLTVLAAATETTAQPKIGRIFTDSTDAAITATTAGPINVRARATEVDLAKLRQVCNAGRGQLTLNLFDDAAYTGIVQQVTVHSGGCSMSGRLDEGGDGRFNLVVSGEVLAAVVRGSRDGTYSVRYLGPGKHVVRQVDPSAFPPCGVTSESTHHLYELLVDTARTGAASKRGDRGSADDGSVHDILVLYSDVTREAAGGTAAIRAEIQLAVDVANSAYADSAVASRLRLVHMEEVAYDEDTGWDGYMDHLIRLGVPDDGYFDHIHELRDRLGADFVSLIVEDTDPDVFGNLTCGVAPVMQEMSADFEALAFSVVSRVCSADNWTLVHEVGHNQGCAHDRDNASVDGLFPYSYGHRFTGDARGWSTIMAYDDAENTWQRFGQFSNPNLSHDGAATGVPIGSPGEAHNTATINSTGLLVAGFRTTRYWVDLFWSGLENGLFESPFATVADGLAAVPEGGMVVVKSGHVRDGMILSKRLKVNSWNGSTVIGAGGR